METDTAAAEILERIDAAIDPMSTADALEVLEQVKLTTDALIESMKAADR